MTHFKNKHLSLKQAAKIFGYSSDYIGYLIRKRKIKGKKVHGTVSWQVSRQAIIEYCEKRKRKVEHLNTRGSKYLSLKQAAKISGYSFDYIGFLIRKGKIKGRKIPTQISWLVSRKEIDKYQASKSQKLLRRKNQLPSFVISFSRDKIFSTNWRLALTTFIIICFITGFAPIKFLQGSIAAVFFEEPQTVNFYNTFSYGNWQNPQNVQGMPNVEPFGDINLFSEANSAVYKTGTLVLVSEGFALMGNIETIEQQSSEPELLEEPLLPEETLLEQQEITEPGIEEPSQEEPIQEEPVEEEPVDESSDEQAGLESEQEQQNEFQSEQESPVQESEPIEDSVEPPISFLERIKKVVLGFRETGIKRFFNNFTVGAKEVPTYEELNRSQLLSVKIKFSFAIGEKEPDISITEDNETESNNLVPEEPIRFWNRVKKFFGNLLAKGTFMAKAEETVEVESIPPLENNNEITETDYIDDSPTIDTTNELETSQEISEEESQTDGIPQTEEIELPNEEQINEEIQEETIQEESQTEEIELPNEEQINEEIQEETIQQEETIEEEPIEEESIEEEIIEEEAIEQLLETQEESSQEVLPNLDTKIIIWWSLDGNNWQILDTISGDSLSNTLNNGYFEYDATFLRSWDDIKNLKVQFEGVVGGESNTVAYLDSIWVEANYQKKELEEEEEFELKAIKKDWRADETPTFEIVPKKEKNIIENLIGQISSVFEEEPKVEAKLDNPQNQELELQEGEDFSAETHSPTKITIFKPEDFRPGRYHLKITFEKNGKVFEFEQDFTWGVLAINTNKSIYLPDETAYLQMAALRDDGHTICDANLRLEITSPNGQMVSPEIQKSGKCDRDNVVDVTDYFSYYQMNDVGTYRMKLINLDNSYEITDSFHVIKSVPFEVERTGPTRIYPVAMYGMTFKIKTNQNFQGQVIETVPDSFMITETIDQRQEIKNGKKLIIWDVDWEEGETYELKYQFDAPNISPYLYLLGPLSLEGEEGNILEKIEKLLSPETSSLIFEEIRQWQIASDAIALTYTETIASFACGVGATWTNYDLFTNQSVPKGAIAEIVAANKNTDAPMIAGVRTDESSIDRYMDLHEAEGGGVATATMLVKVDSSSGFIECYSEVDGDVDFYLLGYFEGVDFTEAYVDMGTQPTTWTDKDLSGYSVPANAVVQVLAANAVTTANYFVGARENGSGLERGITLDEAEGGGYTALSFIVQADESSIIEWKGPNNASVDMFLLGWFGAMEFVEAFTQVTFSGDRIDGVWESRTLTDTMPANSIVSMTMAHQDSGAENDTGLRVEGGSQSRMILQHEAEGGSAVGFMASVTVDADKKLEIYSTDSSESLFYYSGWFKGPVLVSGYIRQESVSSPYEGTDAWVTCDGSTTNISWAIDGVDQTNISCADADGAFEFGFSPASANQVITIWLDTAGGDKGVLYTKNNDTTSAISNVILYKDKAWIQSESSESITNTNINTYDKSNDSDIPMEGSTGVVDSGIELHINTGDTYAPGGNVSVDKLHVKGIYTGASENLTLSGSGTSATCDATVSVIRPLCIDGGTFTPTTNTTAFTGSSASSIEGTTYNNLNIGGSATTTTYTAAGDMTVESVLTIVSSSGTNTFDADTRTITLSGSGTPFVIQSGADFQAQTSTVQYTADADTNITATTYHNLELIDPPKGQILNSKSEILNPEGEPLVLYGAGKSQIQNSNNQTVFGKILNLLTSEAKQFVILARTVLDQLAGYFKNIGEVFAEQKNNDTPKILNAWVEPEKVVPGDTMIVTAEIEDDYGIKSVTADMGGIETIELELVEGNIQQGVWQNTWNVHSTEYREYVTTITATNILGYSSSKEVTWSDPPSTVGTSTVNAAVRDVYERKSFYAEELFWAFYHDGTNAGWEFSADGTTWDGAFTSIGACSNGYHFSIWYDGTYIHYSRIANYETFYRRGTPVNNGTINWSAAEQTVYSGDSSDVYPYPNIAVDTNGYAWIGALFDAGAVESPYVLKNANLDGTWALDFAHQLSTTDANDWRVSVIPLTDGKVYVVYARVGQLPLGQMYDGDWDAGEETDLADYATVQGYMFSAVAIEDNVHFVYNRNVTYQIRHNERVWDVGWNAVDVLVQDNASFYNSPALSADPSTGELYCFWTSSSIYGGDDHVYYKKYDAGWDVDPTDWIDESTDNIEIDYLVSSFYMDYGDYIGLLYVTKTASPYNVRFAFLSLTVPPIYTLGTDTGQTLNATGYMKVGDGEHEMTVNWATYDPTLNIGGNLTLNNYTTWTKSDLPATLTWSPTGTKTLTDNNSTKQDIGIISLTGGSDTPKIQLETNAKATTIAIADGHELILNNKDLEITGGSLTTASTGTVTCTSCSAGTATILGTGNLGGGTAAMTFYNLTLGNGSESATTTAQGSGAINILNVLDLTTNKTLNAGSKTWILSRTGTPFVKTGTLTPSTSTFKYTHSGTYTGPNTIATDSATTAMSNRAFMRDSFYANGRFWVFYSNGTNGVYKTSTDGIVWTSETIFRSGAVQGITFAITFDGTYAHYVYTEPPALSYDMVNNPVYYRRGIPGSDGTITWSAVEQTAQAGDATKKQFRPNIAIDSAGYPWITYQKGGQTSGNYQPFATKSSTNDGTWTTASGFPVFYDLLANYSLSLIPLTGQKMYWITAGAYYIKGFLWSGSWGSAETIDGDGSTSFWVKHSGVNQGDDVHVIYINNSEDVAYKKRTYGVGWDASSTTVHAGTVNSTSLSIDTSTNDLYAFWLSDPTTNHVYYKKMVSGTWDTDPTDWIDESSDGITNTKILTSYYQDYGDHIGFVYMTATSDPYNIRFATFNFRGSDITYITDATYNNLELSPSSAGGPTYRLGTASSQTITCNSNLTIGDGANAVAVTAATHNPTLNVDGNFAISSNGTFVASASATSTFAGDWSNSGIFTHSSGTMTFDGTSQLFAGSSTSTFYNWNITGTSARTVTFTASANWAVANSGSMSWSGASGQILTIVSSSPATRWNLVVGSTPTFNISYVTVSDSDASGGTEVDASNGTNSEGPNSNLNWLFTSSGITVSGNILGTDESTWIGNPPCDGSTQNVKIVVDGTTAYTTSCAVTTGYYERTGVVANSGAIITVWLDTNGVDVANTVTKSAGSNISGLNLYEDRLIVRYETGASLTNADLAACDKNSGAECSDTNDFFFTSDTGALTLDSGKELHIWTGNTFQPGGTVTTSPSASASSADGDIHIDGTGVLTMGTNALSVGGDFNNEGTFNKTNPQTTTFTATATGHTITDGGENFDTVVFNGASGGWSFADATIIDVDLTMTTGILSGTNNITVNGGDVTGDGDINLTNGTFLLAGTGDFGGATAWDFSSLTFGDGTTDTTTATGAGSITVSSVLTIANLQTLDAKGKTWTISGTGTPLVVTGTLNDSTDSSTFKYTGNGATNITASTGYNNLQIFPGGASVTHTLAADTFTLTGNLDLGGNSNATSTVVTAGTNSPTINVKGNVTICAATCSNQMTFTKSSNTLTFNGSTTPVTWTDNNPTTKQDLGTISIDGPKEVDLGSSITVTKVDVTSGDTLDFQSSGYTLTLTGSGAGVSRPFIVAGTLTEGTSSTVSYTGTGATDIEDETYWNLDFSPASGTQTYTLNAGTIDVDGNLSMTGATALTVTAATNNSVIDVEGNVTINANATLTASSSAAFTVGGNFTDDGTFTANSGTVTFDTTGTSVIGGAGSPYVTFFNLTSTTPLKTLQFEIPASTEAIRIDGKFTIEGSSSNQINIQSNSGSTQWLIDHQGIESVQYADIQDSGCASGTTNISLDNTSTSVSNNGSCWLFPSLSFILDAVSKNMDLNSGNTFTTTATSTLTVTARAGLGYNLTAFETDNLRHTADSSITIPDWTGTNASPTNWDGNCPDNTECGWGYSTDDGTLGGIGDADRFVKTGGLCGTDDTCWAGFASSGPGDIVADSTGPVTSDVTIVSYKASVSLIQEAGPYETIIRYILTPQF